MRQTRKLNFLTGPVQLPAVMALPQVKERLIPTETGAIIVGVTAPMRKIFKTLFFTLPLSYSLFTAALAEVPGWRLWLLQDGEVLEAAGHFLVKKTRAVKSARLDIETRKMTMSARSDILLHQAYQNSQDEKKLCGRASGILKGFKQNVCSGRHGHFAGLNVQTC